MWNIICSDSFSIVHCQVLGNLKNVILTRPVACISLLRMDFVAAGKGRMRREKSTFIFHCVVGFCIKANMGVTHIRVMFELLHFNAPPAGGTCTVRETRAFL